jgi:rod shape-determining protein MreD
MPMRERETWRIWPVLWLLLGAQSSVLGSWRPFGVDIDWVLLSVVSVSILLGWPVGALYGLVAGLATGLTAGVFPGAYALSRTAVGGVLAGFEKQFSADNPLAAPLGAIAATILANAAFALVAPASFSFAWWAQRTLWQLPLHAVLIVPLHLLMTRLVLPPSSRLFGPDRFSRLS